MGSNSIPPKTPLFCAVFCSSSNALNIFFSSLSVHPCSNAFFLNRCQFIYVVMLILFFYRYQFIRVVMLFFLFYSSGVFF